MSRLCLPRRSDIIDVGAAKTRLRQAMADIGPSAAIRRNPWAGVIGMFTISAIVAGLAESDVRGPAPRPPGAKSLPSAFSDTLFYWLYRTTLRIAQTYLDRTISR